MTDLYLDWQGDFQPSASGDLMLVDGNDEVYQRLFRRLCTATQGYIWHIDYGAGLPQKIGDPWSVTSIQAICVSQLAMEQSVAPFPPPVINVTEPIPGTISIDVQYTDGITGESVAFNITV
jgi:hypothetical protein